MNPKRASINARLGELVCSATTCGYRRVLLCCVLLVMGAANVSRAGAQNHSPGTTLAGGTPAGESSNEEMWLEVRVFGQQAQHTLLLLRQDNGRVLIRGKDLKLWRLRIPVTKPVQHLGADYYLLDDIAGISYQVDETHMTLKLEAAPYLFESTEIEKLRSGPKPTPATGLGAFLNYDINTGYAGGKTSVSGLFELGLFGGKGVATSSFLANDHDFGANAIRLDSTWTRDIPALLSSFRVGDAISGASGWGRSMRFGGIQWATNFSTQPGFITFPMPTMSGEAALPSSMDLYVNGILRMRNEVPSGPFSITELPVMTGGGEVQLVVRDILGREQLITQSFYTSSSLLQKGLHEYSYELGGIRENYGISSNDYGRFMAVATHRLGLTPEFTAEARAELLPGQQTVGLSGALLWQDKGVFQIAMAASQSDRGKGGLVKVGFDHHSPILGFGLNAQYTSDQFTQLGLLPEQPAPRLVGNAYVSIPLHRYGSVNLNYSYRDDRVLEKFETLGASYSISLGRVGHLSASVTHFFGTDADTSFGLTLTRSLGARTTASANASFSRNYQQLRLQAQRNLPVGSGFGYRTRVGLLDADSLEAGIGAQTDYGTYHLDVARHQGETSYRANISGGLAFLGGGLHPSRRITSSFAVVKVDEYEDVRVYADNQVVATTGSDGSALIPRLRAYESNKVRIEIGDLPMDAQIEGAQLETVPYFRSGLLLSFPVKRSRGGLITIVLDNGELLPAGILVKRLGDGMEFPTGYNGLVYMTGFAERNRLRVTWLDQSCEFEVEYSETTDPLPDLGTFTCSGVNP